MNIKHSAINSSRPKVRRNSTSYRAFQHITTDLELSDVTGVDLSKGVYHGRDAVDDNKGKGISAVVVRSYG